MLLMGASRQQSAGVALSPAARVLPHCGGEALGRAVSQPVLPHCGGGKLLVARYHNLCFPTAVGKWPEGPIGHPFHGINGIPSLLKLNAVHHSKRRPAYHLPCCIIKLATLAGGFGTPSGARFSPAGSVGAGSGSPLGFHSLPALRAPDKQ